MFLFRKTIAPCALGTSFWLALAMLPVQAQDHVAAEIDSQRAVIERQLEIEILEKQLRRVLESDEPQNTKVLDQLKTRLVDAKHELAELRSALYRELSSETGKTSRGSNRQQQAQRDRQVEELQLHIRQLEHEVQELNGALTEADATIESLRTASGSTDDMTTTVFHLKYLDGRQLQQTLHEVLGDNTMRLALAGNPQTLVISAPVQQAKKVHDLISSLDNPGTSAEHAKSLAKSLMMRIFWVSDGPTFSGALATTNLPTEVRAALKQLGINDPFLVLQSNTAFNIDPKRDQTYFEISDVPANVYFERLLFNAEGRAAAIADDQIQLELEAKLMRSIPLNANESGYKTENQIHGSMILPLNHYMILGTSNYFSPDTEAEDGTTTSFAFVVQVVENHSVQSE